MTFLGVIRACPQFKRLYLNELKWLNFAKHRQMAE